jgi:hypothetical protein
MPFTLNPLSGEFDYYKNGGGVGTTNLSYDAGTRVVSSDTGTDATLTLADGTNAGLMASADFTKLAGISGTNTGDQTVTNSSNASSHTLTLSASGGSVQLVEGANITLTTTGSASAGIVTIAATGGGGGGTSLGLVMAMTNIPPSF